MESYVNKQLLGLIQVKVLRNSMNHAVQKAAVYCSPSTVASACRSLHLHARIPGADQDTLLEKHLSILLLAHVPPYIKNGLLSVSSDPWASPP